MSSTANAEALSGGKTSPESPIDWSKYTKKAELSEPDSDEENTSRKLDVATLTALMPKLDPHERLPPATGFKDFRAKSGTLSAPGETFCLWNTIKKYPQVYIGNANRERVAAKFFDHGALENRQWDFFYLYRTEGVDTSNPAALILVPTEQFIHFLQTINRYFHTELTIPGSGGESSFRVTFEADGTPRPRFLGRSTSKEMAANLRKVVPPSYYKLDGEPDAVGKASDRSLAAFKAKIDMMSQSQKGKKEANKAKQKQERINKQHEWCHSLKRVQRYLGLRQVSHSKQIAAIKDGLKGADLGWGDYEAAVAAAAAKLLPQAKFDPARLAPYDFEGSVIFICVDVEAYEKNINLITEIGISTLDTEDLKTVLPGKEGENWLSLIRARHFRIEEHKNYHNKEYVDGCADRFEFGDSEFIRLKDAPQVVASCFKAPFSKPGVAVPGAEDPKRNIILVGHDIGADISFLQKIGYNVYNLSNLLEIADTASMWRYVKRDVNPRNLGSILAELDITGWNLHNAGNDAAYTLQAMVKIAIKHLQDREKGPSFKEQETKERIAESIKEATAAALDREQGWSSSGENSDGGNPVKPSPKPTPAPKKPQSRYGKDGPWKNPPQPYPQQVNGTTYYDKQSTWSETYSGAYEKPKAASWSSPPQPPHMRAMKMRDEGGKEESTGGKGWGRGSPAASKDRAGYGKWE